MNLPVFLFLCSIILIGFASTYVLRTPLLFEERVVFGATLGAVQVSCMGFLIAWLTAVNWQMILITLGVLLLIYSVIVLKRRDSVRADFESFCIRFRARWRDPASPKTLLFLLGLSSIVSARILSISYGRAPDGGVTAAHLSIYGDWSAHLSYAASFAYGDNFPPKLPTAAGESFSYHFGVDWFSAMFIPLGTDVFAAMQISTFLLAAFFPCVLYCGCRRFTSSIRAAILAVTVFLLSGGTGAIYRFIFVDLPDHGFNVLRNLPRSYAFDGFDRNWVDNAVTGFLYPQRPTLIGFSALILVIVLLLENTKTRDPRTYIFAGLMTGLLPIFHVFAFGALMLLTFSWWLMRRRKYWFYFLSPSLLIGTPIVIWQLPDRDGKTWHFLWVLGKSSWGRNPWDFFWFWFLNTGFFIPLAIWGIVTSQKKFQGKNLPLFIFLVIPNIAIWHFWPGNNAKYVILFLLLASPFVGQVIDNLLSSGGGRAVIAIGLVISLTLTGVLDLWRAIDQKTDPYPVGYLSGADVLVGEWIRENTAKDSVFASANTNTHPVRVIAGRTVISGFPGRLNDLGVNWYERDTDLKLIYGKAPNYESALTKYSTDYVIFGPRERELYNAGDAGIRWLANDDMPEGIKIVYDLGDYQIYDVKGVR